MVTIVEYLYKRLHEIGVRALHGVPGDFNLVALDYVEKCGLTWVSNCNELNAAYAADGYARLKGISAVATTYGVGELSAINAIAGAYSEFVPVVHIVGAPPVAAQEKSLLLHHTLGNGDFNVFWRIGCEVSVAQTNLNNVNTAAAEIDRVLRACYIQSRPVYIQLPSDMAAVEMDHTPLNKPIDLSDPKNEPEAEIDLVRTILTKLYNAKKPVLLIDAGAHRHRVLSEIDALMRKTNLPTVVAPMGKSCVNEYLPSFAGLYNGSSSTPAVRSLVEDSDLVLTIGNVKSDLNTSAFSYRISRLNSIDLHFDETHLSYATYKVYMKGVLQRLLIEMDPAQLSVGTHPTLTKPLVAGPTAEDKAEDEKQFGPDTITHSYLWHRMSSWIRDTDVLVADTGTSSVGLWGVTMPAQVTVMSQILWASIGYATGAAQGAAIAAREIGKGQRTIVFEGDGSFHLVAQELSTIIAHDLDVIFFLIENNGYTIERWVHGPNAGYNDRPQWRYADLPRVFVPVHEESKRKVKSCRVENRAEFEKLLVDPEFCDGQGLRFVELHMPTMDAPVGLKDFFKNSKAAAANSQNGDAKE